MFKMIIESNHEKLKADGKYKINEFDALIRDICLDTHFKETAPNTYELMDGCDELGEMLVLDVKFDKVGYIVPNLKKWTTYSDREGEVDQLA